MARLYGPEGNEEMMIKTIAKWIVWVVLAAATAVASTAAALEGNHRRSLEKQVKEQSVVIDSRDQPLLDVKLYVTDKSRNTIYGRYNKGWISMPQERRYILEVDSVNMRVRN